MHRRWKKFEGLKKIDSCIRYRRLHSLTGSWLEMFIQTTSLQTLLSGVVTDFPIASIALRPTCTLGFVQYLCFSILSCNAWRGNSKNPFCPCLFIFIWHSFPPSQGLSRADCTQADFQLMPAKYRNIPPDGLLGDLLMPLCHYHCMTPIS